MLSITGKIDPKSAYSPAVAVQATRTRRRFQCGMYEESPGDGYQYFKFGKSRGDYLVWKKNGLLTKAKDIFCGYDNGRLKRHQQSRNSASISLEQFPKSSSSRRLSWRHKHRSRSESRELLRLSQQRMKCRKERDKYRRFIYDSSHS